MQDIATLEKAWNEYTADVGDMVEQDFDLYGMRPDEADTAAVKARSAAVQRARLAARTLLAINHGAGLIYNDARSDARPDAKLIKRATVVVNESADLTIDLCARRDREFNRRLGH